MNNEAKKTLNHCATLYPRSLHEYLFYLIETIMFSHSMFNVAMNFCKFLFKSVEVLEKNVKTFLFNETC